MAKKKKIDENLLDEELMMACAYRYAIGRHTYVVTLAPYIAKKFYNKLSDNRLIFDAMDIRRSIADNLRYSSYNFNYDGTVGEYDRFPIEDFLTWLSENVKSKDELKGITEIECYKESYKADAPKKFRVSRVEDNPRDPYISTMDINDLLPWADLASLFDKKHYKKLHVKYNGKEEDVIAFETWRQKTVPIPDQPGYCKFVDFQWEKCYIGVDNYLEHGDHAGYIWHDYIVSIEDYDATQE